MITGKGQRKGQRGRAAASSTFKLPQDILGESGVKVVRDNKCPGGQSERTGGGSGASDGSQLRNGMAATNNDDALTGLDPGKHAGHILLQFCWTDSTHRSIVTRSVRPNQPLEYTGRLWRSCGVSSGVRRPGSTQRRVQTSTHIKPRSGGRTSDPGTDSANGSGLALPGTATNGRGFMGRRPRKRGLITPSRGGGD
jgi:hypothetical protein